MFDPIEHEIVGQDFMFMPPGKSPFQIRREAHAPRAILITGDRVTVESAWTRPFLSDDAPDLFYVRSHNTGEATHVVRGDLKLLFGNPNG